MSAGHATATARNASPSNSHSMPKLASQMRVAFASMVSNTGSQFARRARDDRSTSAVAVCCSSASASFFFSSVLDSRTRSTWVLAFVPVERRPVMRVRLFAPLRAKITSSAQSLSPSGRAQPRIEPVNPNRTALMNSRLLHSITSSARASRVGWHIEAEIRGGLEVDHQLELGRLHDRQVRRLCSSEDTTYIDAHLSPSIGDIGTIAYQPASFWNFARCRYHWNDMPRRQIRKLYAPAREERIGSEEQRVEPLAYQS